ncbi:MAG TPA: hypothetical protein PKK43_08160 [Spirochaetota bacterium]|nr:hypothetical protein [Spirochaetota bacterium]
MNKVFMAVSVLAMSVLMFSCGADDVANIGKANARVKALESAINSHSYTAFLACFADASSYQDSYTSDQFDTAFPSGVTYSFGGVSPNGDNEFECTSTKSSTDDATYDNDFTMVEENDDLFIKDWSEGGEIIWQIPKKK